MSTKLDKTMPLKNEDVSAINWDGFTLMKCTRYFASDHLTFPVELLLLEDKVDRYDHFILVILRQRINH